MHFNQRMLLFGLILIIIAVSSSCAPGDKRWNQDINPGHRAGFFAGVWHGFIIIITFIVSLFAKSVHIYEVNNTGWGYDLGFLLGLCFSFLAPWRLTRSRGHKKAKVECD